MELNVERPISVQQIPHIHIQTEQTENYTNFDLLNKQRNIRKRPFLVSFEPAVNQSFREIDVSIRGDFRRLSTDSEFS